MACERTIIESIGNYNFFFVDQRRNTITVQNNYVHDDDGIMEGIQGLKETDEPFLVSSSRRGLTTHWTKITRDKLGPFAQQAYESSRTIVVIRSIPSSYVPR